MLVLAAAVSLGGSADAVKKVKGEYVSVMTTDELMKTTKTNPNQIIVEKCFGIVDKTGGMGHVIGHKDWEMDYSELSYKGKPLKKGTKVMTYLPCDPMDDLNPLARYDYIKVRGKDRKYHWKLISVY